MTWHEAEFRATEEKTNISGLMDGGAYMSEARSWSNTPVCSGQWAGKQWQLLLSGQGEVTSYRGNKVRLARQLPGKQIEAHIPYRPCDKLSSGR